MSTESTPMLAAERQQRLLEELRTFGRISAAGAAEMLGTSTETIRKDLILLENRGLLRRVHGGALHVAPMTFESDVTTRSENAEEKERIAVAALEHLPDGGAVVIDAGSTTQAFVDRFPNRPLRVYTNALAIASTLASRSQVKVSTFGGQVRPVTTAQVGPMALRAIERMDFDIAFVGTNAISVERGLATPDEDEAAMKAALIEHAERTVLLADHTKFAQRSLVTYAQVTDVDLIITGTELDATHRAELAELDVEVEFA
ncbi:DeoR/GlpR family DNA-binding transcription regulator [Aeromicrobium camelliae]|nr:DeoR/GlpR family DNA-binding transcription regulator [Aeromicrobium camelliae]